MNPGANGDYEDWTVTSENHDGFKDIKALSPLSRGIGHLSKKNIKEHVWKVEWLHNFHNLQISTSWLGTCKNDVQTTKLEFFVREVRAAQNFWVILIFTFTKLM